MSFTIVLLHDATTLVALPVSTFFQPSSTLVYDTFEPPQLVGVDKAWTIKGSLKGTSEANASSLWTTLRAIIEGTGTQQVNGCRLVQGASNVIEDLSTTGSYSLVKIESLSADPSARPEREWHSEVNFTLRITGRHQLVNVAKLEQTDAFAYSSEGLLTRTLAGTITTRAGTSAVGQARTLGLTLPGAQYAFVTAGPEGVDVTQLDANDTRASFVSSYTQSGSALPSGVAGDFSVRVETSTTAGERLTVTTVNASGPGAAAAVAAKKPSGDLFSSAIASDAFTLRATGVFVAKQLSQPGRMLMLWSFSISGGQPGAGATQRTGGREAALHVLPMTEVRITETISVQVIGTPSDGDFTMPAALSIDGVLLDGGARVDPGHRTAIGDTRAQDHWVAGCVRNYVAASVPSSLPTLIGQQVLRPDSSATKATTPGKILSQSSSGGGNDLTGLGGLGFAGGTTPVTGNGSLNLGVL